MFKLEMQTWTTHTGEGTAVYPLPGLLTQSTVLGKYRVIYDTG